ncbi:MAG: PAS domain S-box protein [Proteobacteria bacterium]|nr:PAS domain S-box protein [Pseudomonadota bacterium]MBU1738538.1 PAS domain S-box protein [Pseudomonadota bacterium]
MKLRSQIFLVAFALGILPILTLVAVNLSGHIKRHEQTGLEQTRASLALKTENLAAAIEQRRQLLEIILSLPGIRAISAAAPPPAELTAQIAAWLAKDPAITGISLQNAAGSRILSLARQEGTFTPTPDSAPEPAPGTVLTVISESGADRQIKSRLFLDPQILLQEYRDSYWITPAGYYFHQPEKSFLPVETDSNALEDFQGLAALLLSAKPEVWESGSGYIVAWLPLFLDGSAPTLWIGSPVDRTAARAWKRSLIQNIVLIIMALSAIIFIVAGAIAGKIDTIRAQIISGLDRVLNHGEEFRFSWTGPKEITAMAEDLSRLATNYCTHAKARQEAEKALNENRENFLNLTNSAQDAIIFMDPDGNISFWNQAAEEIFGYTKEEAEGKAIHRLISPKLADEQEDSMHSGNTGDGPIKETIELITTRKNGTEVPIELSLSEARIRERWHSIWIIRDISERKWATEKTRLQQQQLIQADKMASLGLLVSGVAHEINNPNSISLLNTTMLAKSWQSVSPILERYYTENGNFLVAGLEYSEMREQIPRLFHELDESAKRIKAIVKDLKDYARQDSTSLLDRVNINDICETAIRLTGNLLKNSTDNFTVSLSRNIPPIKGNSQRLEQVLINLLQNSCDALENNRSAITVETGAENNTVYIRVSDEGCGVPPESINKLTDPFFTTKRNTGGTGLGLSVSAGIIKEHNGTMHITSQKGKGTTVTVSFPTSASAGSTISEEDHA